MADDHSQNSRTLSSFKQIYIDALAKRHMPAIEDKRLEDLLYIARRHFQTPMHFVMFVARSEQRQFELMHDLLLSDHDKWFADNMAKLRDKFAEYTAIIDPGDERPFSTFQSFIALMNTLDAQGQDITTYSFVTLGAMEELIERDANRNKLH